MDILVIGAGIFGCTIANKLAEDDHNVVLIDQQSDIMEKASKVNHNRIHFGYHYPRSLDTAKQCIDSLSSFLLDYGESVISNFPNYYAISKSNSYIKATQFELFCEKLKIYCKEEYPDKRYLNRTLIENCYRVREPIFSYDILKKTAKQTLETNEKNIKIKYNTSVLKAIKKPAGFLVTLESLGKKKEVYFNKVVNASYAGLNNVSNIFGELPIDLRFESTIVPVFECNNNKIGLTVMDGPFCTVMPFGNHKNKFLLWNVDESVLENAKNVHNVKEFTSISQRDIKNIYKKSSLYLPFLKNVKHVKMNTTVKTVVENKYDARKTEVFIGNNSDFISVLSGKIMCCVRIAYEISSLISGKNSKVIL